MDSAGGNGRSIGSPAGFEHLWERGFRRFAFCGYQSAHYSQARLLFFRELVDQAGCPLQVYESSSPPNVTLTQVEEQGQFDIESLITWLGSFKPQRIVCVQRHSWSAGHECLSNARYSDPRRHCCDWCR